MTVIQLCVISSFFRDEFKRLTFVSRKSRKKQTFANIEVSRVDFIQIDLTTLKSNIKKMTREWVEINKNLIAFEVFVVLQKKDDSKRYSFEYQHVKTNQDLNLILIDSKFAQIMRLRFRFISEFVKHQVTMTMISEQRKILSHWVMFNINAKDIKRRLFAFVNSNAMKTKLLLDLFWLKTVKAQLNIEIKIITIDDKMLHENSTVISFFEIVASEMIKDIIKAIRKENKRIKKIINDRHKNEKKSEKNSSDETDFDIDELNDNDSNDSNDANDDENFQ